MRFLTPCLIILSVLWMVQCGGDNSVTPPASRVPTISSVNPNQLSRGERIVTISVTGTNLLGVSSVSFGADIIIHGWRTISATNLEVDISVERGADSGARSISVTAEGGSVTSAAIFTVGNNEVPIAEFIVRPSNGTENDIHEFDGSLSTDDGRITDYLWEFDDNSSLRGKIVTKKFPAGTYEVTLTVTDNNGKSNSRVKGFKVAPYTETVCRTRSRNRGLLYGTVIRVEPGNNAIVKLDSNNSTCANSFYECGDMRNAEVDLDFFGIISAMTDLGNDTFRITNDCPFKWPPRVGNRVFLFYKGCDINSCP